MTLKVTPDGFQEVGYVNAAGNYYQVSERVWVDDKGIRTVEHTAPPEGWRSVEIRPSSQHAWEGGQWVRKGPDRETYIPKTISDRQFFQLLALDGIITEEEALAAVKSGEMPEKVEAFISAQPAEEQFTARMLFAGATTFERGHPLVEEFGEMQGMSSVQIDDLWVRASLLK